MTQKTEQKINEAATLFIHKKAGINLSERVIIRDKFKALARDHEAERKGMDIYDIAAYISAKM